ncbi:hypothetical protein [Chamaesiphon polymorphus]|uniref:hypothetical protein n=1 Tax=Chamaesiphon polymorphus TaxID=2107691 RepID=UPI0015E7DD96|nr:hypothetical protein [Chamaesiphon polymorphus]
MGYLGSSKDPPTFNFESNTKSESRSIAFAIDFFSNIDRQIYRYTVNPQAENPLSLVVV